MAPGSDGGSRSHIFSAMATWEYRREAYKIADAWQNPELRGLREADGLQQLGAQGWEVVNFVLGPGDHFNYLLKRQVS